MPRHNESDQFSKAETEVEVLAAAQKIDVYAVPDPSHAGERGQMGLLGELSVEPSLFEPFRRTPSLSRIRRCLCKQLTWHHELERRARSAEGSRDEDDDSSAVAFPWLVVIGPGRPETALDAYTCQPIRPGLYEAVIGLQMRVVVLAELPRTRETLLLRMLGAGRLLYEALQDLAALPADAWEKSVATPLLIHFRLGTYGPPAANKEDDVSEEIRAWFEDYQRKLRDEARAEEAARNVLTVLRVRGITVPDAARQRILAEKDPARLERWHELAVLAATVAEVLDEPS